jgi:hypothetical protein
LDHFSICACHPCAGAMLIFSVSFQFYRMSQKRQHVVGPPVYITNTPFIFLPCGTIKKNMYQQHWGGGEVEAEKVKRSLRFIYILSHHSAWNANMHVTIFWFSLATFSAIYIFFFFLSRSKSDIVFCVWKCDMTLLYIIVCACVWTEIFINMISCGNAISNFHYIKCLY